MIGRSLFQIVRQNAPKSAVLLASGGLLLAGWFASAAGVDELANPLWISGTFIALAVLAVEIITKLRQRQIGLDIVAALSMSAALAFGVPLAGNVVGLMYAGGQFLESAAAQRARREMTALLARVPQSALRYAGGALESVVIAEIVPGNRLLVRQGDIVPVDGTVASGVALLDQSGGPIEGFSLDRCEPLFRSGFQEVKWTGQSVARLAGKQVRLRFELRNAGLYAFQFQG